MALGFVLLGCLPIGAQSTVPGTPAGTAFSGWFAAFNGGDATAYAAFVRKNWPDGVQYLKDDADFRAATGGFDLRQVDAASTPAKFIALVQERNSDQFAQVIVTVNAAEPHQILELLIRAAPRPAEFALPHLSADALVIALTGRLQRDTAGDRFSGAVLVARDGKPVFEQAYGLADRERKQPNRTDTLFRIGSMNKMFTAVATMQLVQAGKLSLDGTVGTYLADYPNREVASKVTVRELLAHTGGTGDIFGPEYEAHRLELRTLSDYVGLYGKRGSRVRARKPLRVQQLRLHPARRDRRTGQRPKLLRLRARARLSSGRDGVDRFRTRRSSGRRAQRGLHAHADGARTEHRHAPVPRHVRGRRLHDRR